MKENIFKSYDGMVSNTQPPLENVQSFYKYFCEWMWKYKIEQTHPKDEEKSHYVGRE